MTAKKNTVKLSSGVEVTFGKIPARQSQDMVLRLMSSQLMDNEGNVIDENSIDSMSQATQLQFMNVVMDLVNDILLTPGAVEVKLPKDTKWVGPLFIRSYISQPLKEKGITRQDVMADEDLQRYLYVRYVAIESDEDFNTILNNTLLKSDEVATSNA